MFHLSNKDIKKAFFILLVAFASVVKAQNSIPSIIIDSSGTETYTQRMTEMIAPLDKSQITTRILADNVSRPPRFLKPWRSSRHCWSFLQQPTNYPLLIKIT